MIPEIHKITSLDDIASVPEGQPVIVMHTSPIAQRNFTAYGIFREYREGSMELHDVVQIPISMKIPSEFEPELMLEFLQQQPGEYRLKNQVYNIRHLPSSHTWDVYTVLNH